MRAIICLPPALTDYLMVQTRGTLRAIHDAAWVHALVVRLTTRHEAAPATPWAVTGARWRPTPRCPDRCSLMR